MMSKRKYKVDSLSKAILVVPSGKALMNIVCGVLNIHIVFRRNHYSRQCLFDLSMMMLPYSSSSLSLKVLRGVYRLLFLLIIRVAFVTSIKLFIAVEQFCVCVSLVNMLAPMYNTGKIWHFKMIMLLRVFSMYIENQK